MNKLIKRLLIISNRQDYFGHIIVINFVIGIAAVYLSNKNEFSLNVNSHMLLIVWITITSYGIFTLACRKKADFIFLISKYSRIEYLSAFFITSVIQNFILLIFLFVQLYFFHDAQLYITIITSINHFIYAIAIAGLVCSIIPNYTLGIILIILYYTYFFIDKDWPVMEMYRLFSPVLQLVNLKTLDISNNVSILGISLFAFALCNLCSGVSVKKITWKIVLPFMMSVSVILTVCFGEYKFNNRIKKSKYKDFQVNQITVFYRGIDKNEAKIYGKWLSYISDELIKEKAIESSINKIVVQKYFITNNYLPYLDTPMIPVQIKDGVMYVNIFSKAMMNYANAEFRYDMLQRMTFQYLSTSEEGKHAGFKMLVYISNIVMNPDNSFPNDLKEYMDRRKINFYGKYN